MKGGKLYPLFVNTTTVIPVQEWREAKIGELVDETHVRSRLGALALRPGWHSTEVPLADWIGKMQNGELVQRKDTVWCECEVRGEELEVKERNGLRTIPDGFYFFKTRPAQPFPWIVSRWIMIIRILSHDEVAAICREHGVEAQKMES